MKNKCIHNGGDPLNCKVCARPKQEVIWSQDWYYKETKCDHGCHKYGNNVICVTCDTS